MLTRFTYRHNAMATLWEAVLWGDDEEHLAAVAAAVWDEVDRVERLLSRFDPSSEVYRVNRLASRERQRTEDAVLVSIELFDILLRCRDAFFVTDGFFDITAPSRSRLSNHELPIAFDDSHRTIQFLHSDVFLDFGGFGKGYALDRIAELLKQFGVSNALVHGGTSSVLAVGSQPENIPWRVELRGTTTQIELSDASLSCSATREAEQTVSDIVDNATGQPVMTAATCAVIAPDGVTAEILSTALISMGRERARRFAAQYIERSGDATVRIGWHDGDLSDSNWEWLR